MSKTVICPGSFDPVTLGHLDIIKRAAKMFDHVIVAVLVNSAKSPCFSTEERMRLLKEVTGDIENVEISSFDGLLGGILQTARCRRDCKGFACRIRF